MFKRNGFICRNLSDQVIENLDLLVGKSKSRVSNFIVLGSGRKCEGSLQLRAFPFEGYQVREFDLFVPRGVEEERITEVHGSFPNGKLKITHVHAEFCQHDYSAYQLAIKILAKLFEKRSRFLLVQTPDDICIEDYAWQCGKEDKRMMRQGLSKSLLRTIFPDPRAGSLFRR
ncbi:MAG: hypothetical protein WCP97_08980 [bacterium]